METAADCELCRENGGHLLWSDGLCRVVRIAQDGYPGYCRVIWHAHKREMTDLAASERRHLMSVVFAIEEALRATLQPDKINLASLGNQTPHLHWHVTPRWRDDPHFPNPIWGERQRTNVAVRRDVPDRTLLDRYIEALAEEQGG